MPLFLGASTLSCALPLGFMALAQMSFACCVLMGGMAPTACAQLINSPDVMISMLRRVSSNVSRIRLPLRLPAKSLNCRCSSRASLLPPPPPSPFFIAKHSSRLHVGFLWDRVARKR